MLPVTQNYGLALLFLVLFSSSSSRKGTPSMILYFTEHQNERLDPFVLGLRLLPHTTGSLTKASKMIAN